MKRIGVLADNHGRPREGSDEPEEVRDAFAGVDLIVQCGDAGSWETLDRLERVAPVLGVLGGHNGQGDDERIDGEKRVLAIDGLRVGVVHDLVRHGLTTESAPAFKPTTADFGTALRSFFCEPIDVLFYAGTHVLTFSRRSSVSHEPASPQCTIRSTPANASTTSCGTSLPSGVRLWLSARTPMRFIASLPFGNYFTR